MNEYKKEFLEKVIVDLLDGSSQWYNIQEDTGLKRERCEEISALFAVLVEKHVFGRNVND